MAVAEGHEHCTAGAHWVKSDLESDLSRKIILDTYQDDTKSWEYCRKALVGIYELCRGHNVPLVVTIFPIFNSDTRQTFQDYPQEFRQIHEKIKQTLADKPGVRVLEVLDDLAATGLPTSQLRVPIDGHPNRAWHEVVAARLHHTLKEMGL